MPVGFTGEQTDATELVYLRARYLNPGFGTFLSRDPFEGIAGRPMSLNGYSWVEGNVVNAKDPSGAIASLLSAGMPDPLFMLSLLNSIACSAYQLTNWCVVITPSGDRLYYDCNNFPDWLDPSLPTLDVDEDAIPDFVTGIDANVLTDADVAAQADTQRRHVGCNIPEGANYGIVGTYIHTAIQYLFRESFGPQHTSTNSPVIPRAARDGSGRNGVPDAVLYPSGNPNTTTQVEIYEIKPISWSPQGNAELFAEGQRQLKRYVDNWWRVPNQRTNYATEGIFWNPNQLSVPYPLDPTQLIVMHTFYEQAPGMVYYSCEQAGA